MNYIGSKNKLFPFIIESIQSIVGENLKDKVFCDLFAGTGIVSRKIKSSVSSLIVNDLEYYSFVINNCYLGNYKLNAIEEKIKELNDLKGTSGFIFDNYSENGKANRLYFNEINGKKIDSIRLKIEEWKINNTITVHEYYYLLTSLLEATDSVANTAAVFGAYLKHIKKSAQQDLVLKTIDSRYQIQDNKIYNADSNVLIKDISGDILYLDPPYNERQYGANYHLLNTIAMYDSFIPSGKTGLREYNRSLYCKKNEVLAAFKELISNAQFKYIFLSYNNEGLMTEDEIRKVMSEFGKYQVKKIQYQRFKADKTENRNHTANFTNEFLHVLVKN